MRRLAAALGGREETVLGLAGLGDLEVTSLSGRNRVFGARVGRGEPPGQALAAMAAPRQTGDGVRAARPAPGPAARPGMGRPADGPGGRGPAPNRPDPAPAAGPAVALPLLAAVNRILD